MVVTPLNNVSNHWGVLTSCSQSFKHPLSENPSRIGPTFNHGLVQLKTQGYCEILKSGELTYHIKAVDTYIELNGDLLEDGTVAKLESGDKISFPVENGTNQGIHHFVFSAVFREVFEIIIDKDRLKQLLGCSVCYGIIYDCVTLDCMHNFCSDCIMTWLQKLQKCPLCKQKFKKMNKNITIQDICQFYFQIYPLEELSQPTKEERKIKITKSTFEDSDGNIYNGHWKNIKKHGEGEMEFKSGERFKGIFNNDNMEKGEMTYQDNSVYNGDWKNNKKDGQGIFQSYFNGVLIEYRGAFVKDLKHGEGTLIFGTNDLNISSFAGLFMEGNHENQGRIGYTDGSYYQGKIDVDFFRNGTGNMKFANGHYYEGDWKKNKRDQKGKCTFSNRDIYEGDWKDDKIEGLGTMNYANGDVYSGDWLHEKEKEE